MGGEDLVVDQETDPAVQETEASKEEQAMAKLKEAIAVVREEVGPLRWKMTVTIPRDTLDERRGEQFAELKRDALVPGFRKGHAPLKLIEKRFALDVGEQLKGHVIGSGFLAAVEKENIKPLGDPLFWVAVKEERFDDDKKPRKVESDRLLPLDEALDRMVLPKDGPLTFSCEFEVKPEFELPELKNIPVKRPVVAVDASDVDQEIKRLLASRATFRPVERGTIKADDLLYADMKLSVDGERIAGEENFTIAARDLRLLGIPLIGFGDAAKGKKLDAEIVFEAPVPDDHENISFRGKVARFDFTVREVKRMELPSLDEGFVSSLGFEDEAELRSTIRSSLESRLQATIQEALEGQVAEYLLEHTKLDLPPRLSQRQTERSAARLRMMMLQAGVPEAEMEKRTDELQAKAHNQAVRDLKLFFILDRIATDRGIEVSTEELNAAIAQIAQRTNKRFDRVRDELMKGDGLTVLHVMLRDRRALQALLAEAQITETEGPKKEATARTPKKTPRAPKEAKATPTAGRKKKRER